VNRPRGPFRQRELRARTRIVLTAADQFISSLQNFALVILTARAVSAREFGAFALVNVIVILLVGLVRAGIGEPILLGYSARTASEIRRVAPIGMTLTLATGLLIGGLTCGIAMIVPDPLHQPLLAMGVCVPGLVLLDFQRFLAIAWKRPVTLVGLDSAWVVVWIVVLVVAKPTTAYGEILAWGLSGSAVAVVMTGAKPIELASLARASRAWWRDLRRSATSLVAEFVTLNSSNQVSTLLVTGFLGYTATGGLRAAQNLLSPVSTIGNAMRIAVVPEVIRAGGSTTKRGARVLLGGTLAAALIAGGASAAFLSLPASAGRQLLGATWHNAHPLLLASGIRGVFFALTLRGTMALRADLRLPTLAWTRGVSAVVLTVVVAAFAATTDVRTTAWAFVGFAVFQWLLFEAAARRPARSTDDDPARPTRHAARG